MTCLNENDPTDVLLIASDVETAMPIEDNDVASDPPSREDREENSLPAPSDNFPFESLTLYQFLLNGFVFGLLLFSIIINVWVAILCILEYFALLLAGVTILCVVRLCLFSIELWKCCERGAHVKTLPFELIAASFFVPILLWYTDCDSMDCLQKEFNSIF